MNELWRPIPGWLGLYEVSNLGRVRSTKKRVTVRSNRWGKPMERVQQARILKNAINSNGYATVHLYAPNTKTKCCTVHRLVAAAFLGDPPEGKPWVLHGPNGQKDNSAANLYWGDRRQNEADKLRDGTLKRGEQQTNAKLTPEMVYAIRADNRLHRVIANDYPVNRSVISAIKNRSAWTHLD